MPTNSVLTNTSAAIALQSLTATNNRLTDVQGRISTGLKVQGAKDNAAVWAVAQNQRGDMGAYGAVKTSLDRATSVADVSLAAGESISDLLIQLRERAVAAADPSATDVTRKAYNDDFQALLKSLEAFAKNATFDGENILDGAYVDPTATPLSKKPPLAFLANAKASDTITMNRQDLSLEGLGLNQDLTNVVVAAIPAVAADPTATPPILASPAVPAVYGPSLLTEAGAKAAMDKIEVAQNLVTSRLAELGAQAKQIESHNKFVSKLTDALETGIGNLVDADLAKESARLQALQVQQQLGVQALSIANQSPQVILSLFQ